ncbi:hypothetical protein M409DRAFT_27558 [Zasmidium cellare ATCC 36951]|uniref:Uncharacterized protein n=1 Tax=Zasmidium cellare ATCC 36951 TaxID=1080233 RepID=A0A6A6C954_ZASCE|nr:uncharacterized protein M409DRAFT_27558 [Zasmidium cellare ATCC 36951]KAF2162179.1 hypothetical protein M409DRAFT_27558 [Zasmidium cellare ATCC 36951]
MTSAFTSLAAPALEDTMEVSSSPAAGDMFDADIEIDYDDYPGAAHLTDDERMLEDGDPTRPPTATDEMMDDEDHTTTLVEEVMQDDIPVDQTAQPEPNDEELIDYDDDSYLDVGQPFFDDTTLQNTETGFSAPTEAAPAPTTSHEDVTKQQELLTEPHANVKEQNVAPGENAEPAAVEVPVTEEHSHDTGAESNANVEPTASSTAPHESGEALAAVDDAAIDGSHELLYEGEATAAEPEKSDDTTTSLKALPQLPGTLDTTAREVPDGPPTPTDTGLHPMTVNYRDYCMPMFKSSKQPDGLLKNDNLASIGLSNLMQDCRNRLKVKLGEEISEGDDIVLVFDRLGLMLVEGNSSTFNTSLNEIIDVWQQLHFNDGVQDVPPLTVTLTSQPKFSTSVGSLQKAVNDGQGISNIPEPYIAENEEYQDADTEAEPTDEYTVEEEQNLATGEEHYEEHDGHAHEYTEEQAPYSEGAGFQEGYELAEEAHEEHQAYEDTEEGNQFEINYEDYNENEEYPDPEEFGQHEEAEPTAEAVEAPKDQAQSEVTEEKPAEIVKPDSAASSTTVRGDTANDAAGEYYEDLIDWDDDDDLTGYPSEPNANTDDDDFSALLTEYDADAGEAEAGDAQNVSKEYEHAPESTSEPQPPAGDGKEQAPGAADSEDLLGLNDEQQPQGDEAAKEFNNEPQQDNPDDGLIEYEDEAFDEADLIDYDDEDDEQFHTALDLADGDNTEHGPGHSNAAEPNNQPQDRVVDEDGIGYDDDDFAIPETTKGSTNSGKRSFEEHADEDVLTFDDEPELKKARSD